MIDVRAGETYGGRVQIRIGFDLSFEVPQPVPMQLMLYVHPDQAGLLRQPERLVMEPAHPVEDFLDWLEQSQHIHHAATVGADGMTIITLSQRR